MLDIAITMANSISPKKATYSTCAQVVHHNDFPVMLLEPRPFRPFKTSEEYLYAMKEDLAEWLHTLYELDINADNFFKQLETGVVLCGQDINQVFLKYIQTLIYALFYVYF